MSGLNRNKSKWLFACVLVLSVGLAGCENGFTKPDPIASQENEKFKPRGHIQLAPPVDEVVGTEVQIPQTIETSAISLPPLEPQMADLYSVTAINVPVRELLFKIAQDSNREIDIYTGVEGLVTINAIDQTLEEIMSRISDQLNFIYELTGNAIVIRPDFPEWRNYEVDYVNINKTSEEKIDMKMTVSSSTTGSSTNAGSSSKVSVKSEHNFWATLESNIQRLAQLDPYTSSPQIKDEKGKIIAQEGTNTVMNAETGSISVYTTNKKHRAIKEYIEKLTERAQRQVLIEATVVEVILNDQYQAGIDWSAMNSAAFGVNGGVSISSPFAGPSNGFSVATLDSSGQTGAFKTGNWNILASLQFLQTFGDSKVLSSPKIMAINNQTALLKVVNNLVYFTVEVNTTQGDQTTSTTYETEVNTVPVGFTMSVTPFVSDAGDITLNVRPTISRLIGQVADPNPSLANAGVESLIPVIQEKEMSSVLKLKDRQTAIIGGLIEDDSSNNKTGMPWLSDAPYIGGLFSKRDDAVKKSELVIFIRPVIVDNPDIQAGDLKSVGQFLKQQVND